MGNAYAMMLLPCRLAKAFYITVVKKLYNTMMTTSIRIEDWQTDKMSYKQMFSTYEKWKTKRDKMRYDVGEKQKKNDRSSDKKNYILNAHWNGQSFLKISSLFWIAAAEETTYFPIAVRTDRRTKFFKK